jgi:hypothetical protein
MTVIIKRPWRSQPQYPARLDSGNAIARGLYGAISAKTIWRRDSNGAPLPFSDPSLYPDVVTPVGRGFTGDSSFCLGPFPTDKDPQFQASAVTTFFLIACGSLAGNDRPIVTASYAPIRVTTDWSNSSFIYGLGANVDWTAPTTMVQTSGVVYDNQIVCGVASWSTQSQVMTVYERIGSAKRKIVGSTTKTSTILMGGNANQNIVIAATGCQHRVAIISMAFFLRELGEGEAWSLIDNPWQLFEPRQIIIPASAAAGYSHPTMSNARMGSMTGTGGIPLVDYTF